MARIRSIKPEFWDDRKLARKTSRDARLLYIGLWNLADEHGRLNGDPQWIKGQVFSYDDDLDAAAIGKLLEELQAPPLDAVVPYEVDGNPYLFLPKLARHQRLEPEKVKSRLPAPPDRSEPGADNSARGSDNSARGSDESGNGAGESARDADQSDPDAELSALLYGAGSREHVAGSRDARAREPATVEGVQLLREHIAACASRPPKDVLRTLSEKISSLLGEKFTPDQIRDGMRVMRERGKGPGVLPHIVDELANPGDPRAGPHQRPSGDNRRPTGKKTNFTDEEYQSGW